MIKSPQFFLKNFSPEKERFFLKKMTSENFLLKKNVFFRKKQMIYSPENVIIFYEVIYIYYYNTKN